MRAGTDSEAVAGAAKGMPDSGGQNVAKRHTYPPASWDLPLSAKEMSGCPIPVFLDAAEPDGNVSMMRPVSGSICCTGLQPLRSVGGRIATSTAGAGARALRDFFAVVSWGSLVMARSALRNPEEVTSKAPTPSSISDTATVILFDFDGTLGDTETPAMIVAFWELAPYFPEASVTYLSEQRMKTYVRDNAGKAFEFMVDVVEEDRKKAGLPSVESVRTAGSEDPAVLAHVNAERAKSGLPTIEATRALNVDLLTLQKDETVEALATLAKPCPSVPDVLAQLKSKGYDFSIATTSGKPRVPVSVVACQYEAYFPPEKIHSGESDFEPPRFKPDPSVYLVSLF